MLLVRPVLPDCLERLPLWDQQVQLGQEVLQVVLAQLDQQVQDQQVLLVLDQQVLLVQVVLLARQDRAVLAQQALLVRLA